jgi:hypothetical protein
MGERFAAADYRVVDLLRAIVMSEAFSRIVEQPAAAAPASLVASSVH